MDPFKINTAEEYDYCVKRGYEPLLDAVRFVMPIKLRIEIQDEVFGKFRSGIPAANSNFYKWCWERMPHYCQETMKPLRTYSSVYISHIMSRGAHPECAHDPRNVNILCAEAHAKWENGRREEMRIYLGNMYTIERLKQEYREL